VYLQTTPYICLLLRERVDMTRVQRSKKTSTTGHTTTCNLTPTGFQRATLLQWWNRSGSPVTVSWEAIQCDHPRTTRSELPQDSGTARLARQLAGDVKSSD